MNITGHSFRREGSVSKNDARITSDRSWLLPASENLVFNIRRAQCASLSGVSIHFGSLVQYPDEIWHTSAGIPNNDRLSLQ
jgi:hypothetical protein